MEKTFFDAACGGKAEEVKEILRKDPTLDVNLRSGDVAEHPAALHRACQIGEKSVVSILLAHPGIDVNQKSDAGFTPFLCACKNGRISCVRLLLKDSRVNLNEPNEDGFTPLQSAASNGFHGIVKWWIASGREMDLGKPGDRKTDAIGAAKEWSMIEVAELLERFQDNPEETRHVVRVELGLVDELAAEMLALVVFICDDLLEVKVTTTTPAVRFFNIARQLPLELQMVLCFRQVGSAKEIISGRDRESGFKNLAGRV